MTTSIWVHVHGAAAHFPLALTTCSVLCDVSGLVLHHRAAARSLHGAGYWTILLAAGGSAMAVVSGLVMSRGEMLGTDSLLRHHLFAWPAFTLLVGVATWRLCVGDEVTGPARFLYPLFAALAAALMLGAGYWGGEMMTAA